MLFNVLSFLMVSPSIGMVKIESMFMPKQNSRILLLDCAELTTTSKVTISELLMAQSNRILFDLVIHGKHSISVPILMMASQQDIHANNIWNFNNQEGFRIDAFSGS